MILAWLFRLVLVGIRIPPRELEGELRRRLATALFSDWVLPDVSACRMAGMDKAEFQYMPGERGIGQPLGPGDFELELEGMRPVLKDARD